MHDYAILYQWEIELKMTLTIVLLTIISGTIYRSAKCHIVTKPAEGLEKISIHKGLKLQNKGEERTKTIWGGKD